MKKLIALSAIPGSGKSTYAKNYKLNHTDENVLVVSSDEIRKELTGIYQNFNFEKETWELYFKRIDEYRDNNENVTVIADSTNIYNKFRAQVGKIPGFDKKVLVIINKDLTQVFEHNKQRTKSKVVPEDAIQSMHDRWEELDEETASLFDEVIKINGWFEKESI